MKKLTTLVMLSVAFVACTHAVQKSESKWTVKTSTESNLKIWVTRADGSRQCDRSQKMASPAQVAAQVQAAGILVFQSRSGNDGQMHAQECGALTGRTVDLEISRSDVRKALSLGFVTKEAASPDPEAN